MSVEMFVRYTDESGKHQEHGEHFSSMQGLSLISDWAETLDEEKYPHVIEFFRESEIKGSVELVNELKKAIKESPPDNRDLIPILKRAAGHLYDGHPDDMVTLEQE